MGFKKEAGELIGDWTGSFAGDVNGDWMGDVNGDVNDGDSVGLEKNAGELTGD